MSFLSTLFGSKMQQSDNLEVLDAAAFKNAVTGKKVQLVDVRTPREYNRGHIGNAINIDFFQGGSFKPSFEKLNKNRPVYLYCRSGNRSRKAARKLIHMGFTRIYDLKGGYMRWG